MIQGQNLTLNNNLTLTAFNPEMGNRPFRAKRNTVKGYRDSLLRLSADLRQTELWDGDAIQAPSRHSATTHTIGEGPWDVWE